MNTETRCRLNQSHFMSRFSPDSASYPAISMRGHALHIFFSLNLPRAHIQCDYFPPPQGWPGLLVQTPTDFYLRVIHSPPSPPPPPKLFLCEMDLIALMPKRNQPNDIPQRFDILGAVVLFHSISFFFFNPGQGGVCLSVGGGNRSISAALVKPWTAELSGPPRPS